MNQKKTVVFAGDSMIDYFALQEFFAEVSTLNRGIAGDTTSGLLARMHTVADRHLKIEKIFFLIGTNDLASGYSPESVAANMKRITEQIQIDTYVISILPVNYDLDEFDSEFSLGARANKKILQTNALLKELCTQENLTYIDAHRKMQDANGQLKKELTVEGLHLNTGGYKALAEIVRAYL